MPLSDDIKACVGVMWLCSLGMVVTVLLQSPWVFLFAFGLIWSMFSAAKTLADGKQQQQTGNEIDALEMQPLEEGRGLKLRGDMTLGELMNKY